MSSAKAEIHTSGIEHAFKRTKETMKLGNKLFLQLDNHTKYTALCQIANCQKSDTKNN